MAAPARRKYASLRPILRANWATPAPFCPAALNPFSARIARGGEEPNEVCRSAGQRRDSLAYPAGVRRSEWPRCRSRTSYALNAARNATECVPFRPTSFCALGETCQKFADCSKKSRFAAYAGRSLTAGICTQGILPCKQGTSCWRPPWSPSGERARRREPSFPARRDQVGRMPT